MGDILLQNFVLLLLIFVINLGENHCGSAGVAYINDTHPIQPGDTKTVQVCYDYLGYKCLNRKFIEVTNCGEGVYVYHLPEVFSCCYMLGLSQWLHCLN